MNTQTHCFDFGRLAAVLTLVLVLQCRAICQPVGPTPTPVARDPQAAILLAQAVAALTGGNPANDATLNGQATLTAGSDVESGSTAIEVKGHLESKLTLNLSGGQRQEIWRDSQGSWTGPDGQSHAQAFHNSLVIGNWFCPAVALQSLTADASFGLAYVGAESREGVAVQHIQASRVLPSGSSAGDPFIQQLSDVDVYLDATAFLPVGLEFNTHPDFDALRNLPVRVELGSYQSVNGINTPFHIQKFLQNSLALDISLGSATFNSGLPDSDFAIP